MRPARRARISSCGACRPSAWLQALRAVSELLSRQVLGCSAAGAKSGHSRKVGLILDSHGEAGGVHDVDRDGGCDGVLRRGYCEQGVGRMPFREPGSVPRIAGTWQPPGGSQFFLQLSGDSHRSRLVCACAVPGGGVRAVDVFSIKRRVLRPLPRRAGSRSGGCEGRCSSRAASSRSSFSRIAATDALKRDRTKSGESTALPLTREQQAGREEHR